MAEILTNRDARIWHAVRDHYFRMIDEVEGLYGTASTDEIEGAELALSFARKDFWELPAPSTEGVCERIVMVWGDRLDDQNDPDMWALRNILENLRMLGDDSGRAETMATLAKDYTG